MRAPAQRRRAACAEDASRRVPHVHELRDAAEIPPQGRRSLPHRRLRVRRAKRARPMVTPYQHGELFMTRHVLCAAILFASFHATAGQFYEKDGAAIRGYDPVAYFKEGKAVKGS